MYLYDPADKPGLSRKLAMKWTGPYRIKKLKGVTAEIREIHGRKTRKVHVNRLKLCLSAKRTPDQLANVPVRQRIPPRGNSPIGVLEGFGEDHHLRVSKRKSVRPNADDYNKDPGNPSPLSPTLSFDPAPSSPGRRGLTRAAPGGAEQQHLQPGMGSISESFDSSEGDNGSGGEQTPGETRSEPAERRPEDSGVQTRSRGPVAEEPWIRRSRI